MKQAVLCFFFFFLLQSAFSQINLSTGWHTQSDSLEHKLGIRVGVCGDINGDGLKDFFGTAAGSNIYLFYGTVIEMDTVPDLKVIAPGTLRTVEFGNFNGDLYDDLVVSDYLNNQVHIYYGSGSGISSSPDITINSEENSGRFGWSIHANGDINNDGYSDLLVGQPQLSHGFGLYGQVSIYLGSSSGISEIVHQKLISSYGNIAFGYDCKYAGDVNQDGFDDILISSQESYPIPKGTSPFVQLFFGSSAGVNSTAAWEEDANLRSIGTAGDINKDSYTDIFITIFDEYAIDPFKTKIFLGSASGLPLSADNVIKSSEIHVAYAVGDFNDDGYDDMVLNKPNATVKKLKEGILEVYLGNDHGVDSLPSFLYASDVALSNMGSFENGGDINGDGFSDIILGISQYSEGKGNEGCIRVVFGEVSLVPEFVIDDPVQCLNDNSFGFTENSNETGVAFLWDFGDGKTSYERNPTHTYQQAGTYTVSLTITDQSDHIITTRKEDVLTVKPFVSAGTHIIGAGSGEFETISSFSEVLNCGISGNVNVKLMDGIYDEPLNIINLNSHIPGYDLHVTSLSGHRDSVVLAYLSIQNSENVRVSHLTVFDDATLSRDNQSIHLSHAQNIAIDSCNIFRRGAINYSFVRTDTCKLISFTGNRIRHQEEETDVIYTHGIGFYMNGCSYVTISGNDLFMIQGYGVYAYNLDNFILSANSISGKFITGGSQSHYAVHLTNVEGFNICKNRFFRVRTGIYADGLIGTKGMNFICNNFIGGDIGENSTYATANGVTLLNSKNVRFVHNTVSITKEKTDDLSYADALAVIFSDSIEIRNNILAASGKGNGCLNLIIHNCTNFTSDFNFFSGNLNINDNYAPYEYKTGKIAEWRKYSGQDQNSIQGTLGFESIYDLVPVYNSALINSAGYYIPEVDTDIFGNKRSAAGTDLGAALIEHTETPNHISYFNISLTDIYSSVFQPGSNTMQIGITNYKDVPIDSIYISYKIDDHEIVTELWKGELQIGDTIVYSFTTPVNVTKGKIYFAQAWIELPEGKIDSRPENDSTRKEIYMPLKGMYTVYGESPDFTDLFEANYHLEKAGADSMATFLIRPGIYNLTGLQLAPGPATLKGDSPDRQNVVLLLHSVPNDSLSFKDLTIKTTTNPGTGNTEIRISHAIDIIFDNCAVIAETNSYGFYIESTTSNLFFNNCHISGGVYGFYFHLGGPHMDAEIPGHCKIENSSFENIKTAIYKIGRNYHLNYDSLVIRKNIFKNCSTAVFIDGYHHTKNVFIDNNIMDSIHKTGIELYTYISHCYITNNTINSLSNSPAIVIKSCDSILIANNMISLKQVLENTANYAISTSYSRAVKVYNNSIIGGIIVSGGDASLINNSFYSKSTLLMYIASDYYTGSNNNFYREDRGIIIYYKSSYSDINQVYSATGSEKNSLSVNPEYVSESDLHTNSGYLVGRGKPLAEIPLDIDGEHRHLSTPDIGADETETLFIDTSPYILGGFFGESSVDSISISGVHLNSIYAGSISLYRKRDSSLVQDLLADSRSIQLADSVLVVALSNPLDYNEEYFILFDSDVFISYGLTSSGITSSDFFLLKTHSVAPVVNTLSASAISATSAIISAEIAMTGGEEVTETGFCWKEYIAPESSWQCIKSINEDLQTFQIELNELNPESNYLIKAYALNVVDTGFSSSYEFSTLVSKNSAHQGNDFFQVFPNPSTDHLIVDLPDDNKMAEIQLFNQEGMLVKSISGKDKVILNVSDEKSGIYFLYVSIEEKINVAKIVLH